MIVTLDEEQMLDRWCRHKHMGPLRMDASVVRSDLFDIRAMMLAEMRGWYGRVLRKAPLHFLGLKDMSKVVNLIDCGEGIYEVALPVGVVRVGEVVIDGWEAPALVVAPDSHEAKAQANPFGRGGSCHPVVVRYPGRLRFYIGETRGAVIIERLTAVVDDGTYQLDDSLLDFREYVCE